MIFKDIIEHFEIKGNFPDYLLDESFNEIFLEGKFSFKDNSYEITVKTRQNVTHKMIIKENDDFPVTIISELPNGSLNGIKFGLKKENVVYINEL